MIDSEITSTHLKNNSLAPPDLLTNSVEGIIWRLGFHVDHKDEPEGTLWGHCAGWSRFLSHVADSVPSQNGRTTL